MLRQNSQHDEMSAVDGAAEQGDLSLEDVGSDGRDVW
jgi:hypothetical protein